MLRAGTCTVCGHRPFGMYWVSLRGEATCTQHEIVDRCLVCDVPRSPASRGWTDPSPGFPRCPTCAIDAIDRQLDARRRLPAVRQELATLGLRLERPVRVELADLATLSDGRDGRRTLGRTQLRWTHGEAKRQAVLITVAGGLDPVQFGAVVAHEAAHAWLGERGARISEPRIEEGVCEVFAAAWLKRQRTPFADAVRDSIRNNTDPVYGDGFRLVHAAVCAHSIRGVLESIRRTGSLPTS